VGVAEELAGDDVRVGLHQLQVASIKSFLEPMQRLSAVVAFVDARRDVAEYVHLQHPQSTQPRDITFASALNT